MGDNKNPQIDFLIKRISELFNNVSTQIKQIQEIQDRLITDNRIVKSEISNLKIEIKTLRAVINNIRTNNRLNDDHPPFFNNIK